VFLEKKDVLLQELTVHAYDEFLYDLMEKCRKKLLKCKSERVAKVYYGIETYTKEQPVEWLNAIITAI